MSADAVLAWALQTGLVVTMLTVIILCLRRPVTRWFGAGAAYALWILPLLRLFMPPVTIPYFISAFFKQPPEPVLPQEPFDVIIPAQAFREAAATAAPSEFNMAAILVGAWLMIAALWFGYQILRHFDQIDDLRLKTDPVRADLNPVINRAMASVSLKARPDIRMSEAPIGPMVTRFWRPMIILPKDFTQQYNDAQQNFALVHEMAHIKRWDLWAAFLVLAFRALNWPNPLIHYAAHKFRADQEGACDAYLLAKLGAGVEVKQDYARTLLQAAQNMQTVQLKAPLGLALSDTSHTDDEI